MYLPIEIKSAQKFSVIFYSFFRALLKEYKFKGEFSLLLQNSHKSQGVGQSVLR